MTRIDLGAQPEREQSGSENRGAERNDRGDARHQQMGTYGSADELGPRHADGAQRGSVIADHGWRPPQCLADEDQPGEGDHHCEQQERSTFDVQRGRHPARHRVLVEYGRALGYVAADMALKLRHVGGPSREPDVRVLEGDGLGAVASEVAGREDDLTIGDEHELAEVSHDADNS